MEIRLSLDELRDLPLIAEHQSVEFTCAAVPGAWLALSLDGQLLDPYLHPGDTIWRWRWNPGPAVGCHDVVLTATFAHAEAQRHNLTVRVTPRKLDQQRYETLLEDIQRVAYNVTYTLTGASAEGATLHREAPWNRSRFEEYYALFEQRLDRFVHAVRRIAAQPREQLRGANEEVPLGQAAQIDADTLTQAVRGEFDEVPDDIANELQAAIRPGGGLLPRNVPASHSKPTFDIYEHRLLKQLLVLLLRRARFIGTLAEHEVERLVRNETSAGISGVRLNRVRQIAHGCTAAIHLLLELRALPFLAQVRSMGAFRGTTPLLQRDPAYREIYRMWQALRQFPYVAFDSPLFFIPITDLPHLYEAWCVFKVVEALLSIDGTVREQRLVVPQRANDDEDLTLVANLVEQTPMLILSRGDATLTLRYQPHYQPLRERTQQLGSLDRHTRVPDLVIEIARPDQPVQVLVLDAKYRLDADGRGVPQDALADAYAYLGAIGVGQVRATLAALLLYPGAGVPELYPSGVGAVPLVPGLGDGLVDVIKAYIDCHNNDLLSSITS